MSRNVSPQLVAAGNISPSTFVKPYISADNSAAQAGANDPIIGISQVGTRLPPGVDGADAYAAIAGESFELFGLGDICLLVAGSGGFVRGDRLKADASGNGVPVATSGVIQNVGAVALESAAAGEKVRVQIMIFSQIVAAASGSGVFTDITGSDASLDIAGAAAATVTSAGGAVAIAGAVGGATSGAGGAVTMVGGAGTNGNSAGGVATIAGGAGQGSAAGGVTSATGGAGGATGAGGSASLVGGAGGATSGTGGAALVTGGAGTNGNAVGGAATVTAGAGQGTGAGAVASMVGGGSGAGATGNGGVSKIVGGAALSTNGTGGAAQVTGGVATGTGTGGAVTITSGASGGASGTAGNVTVDCGSAASGTAGLIAIGDTNAGATYLARGSLKAVQMGLTLTALGTVQSSTPTSAQLLGGFLTQTGATGAGAVTLPTGTALSAACARTPAVGDSFQCVFANLGGGQTLTITGATGTTVISGGAVATAKTAILTFINTGSNAWSISVAGG